MPATTTPARPSPQPHSDAARLRASFRQPISSAGFIDAAWWPRSRDLSAELPALLETLWDAARDINRVTYNTSVWDPAPRKLAIGKRVVRLGGFATSDPLTIRLTDAWGVERIDILVIDPSADPDLAEEAMHIASASDGPSRAGEILERAANSLAARPE